MRLVNGDLLKDRINRLRMYLARIEGNLDSALITCFQEVIEGNSCPEYETKQSNPLLLAGALAPNSSVQLQGVRLSVYKNPFSYARLALGP